jgi:RHS repeat-associated protein
MMTWGVFPKRLIRTKGLTFYRYSKYGSLRLVQHSSDNYSNFYSYDSLNRLRIVGQYPITASNFDPETTYSWETQPENILVQNMYDKYYKTGAFVNMPDPAWTIVINRGNIKGRLVATAFRDTITDPWSYKVYSYDPLGRVTTFWVYTNNSWRTITNEYDHWGNLVKQNAAGLLYYFYDYDEQGRLKETRTSIQDNKSTAVLEGIYSYNNSDQVSKFDFKNISGNNSFIDYLYNNRGWVDKISLNSITPDIPFEESLRYYNNGNVDSMIIKNLGNPSWPNLVFKFEYTNANMLSKQYCNYSIYNESYFRDNDGNILQKNHTGSLMTFYNISGTNKLDRVVKNSTTYYFAYNSKGNLTTDPIKNIQLLSFNYMNLPTYLRQSANDIFYRYDENGMRVKKQTPSGTEYYLRDHTGRELAVLGTNNRVKYLNLFGNGLIGRIDVRWDSTFVKDPGIENKSFGSMTENITENGSGGYWVYNRIDERSYYGKDHLGNIRLVIDESNQVLSAQDYYPYGEILRGFTSGGYSAKYLFTEKERDIETNYDYFGARYYDSELGRWLSVDPLADKYPGWSPYNYCLNNPLRFIDPMGMDTTDTNTENSPSSYWGEGVEKFNYKDIDRKMRPHNVSIFSR